MIYTCGGNEKEITLRMAGEETSEIEEHMKALVSLRWKPTNTFLKACTDFQQSIASDTLSCLRGAVRFLGVLDQCAESESQSEALLGWFRETRQMVESYADRAETEIRRALTA